MQVSIDLPPANTPLPDLTSAQAVVIWADATIASDVLTRVQEVAHSAPVYLCRKAVEGGWNNPIGRTCSGCRKQVAGEWIAAPPANPKSRETFSQRYRERFGDAPTLSAAEAYDAVRVLASSIRKSGPNRARLRDALSQISAFDGASGTISFDHAGNDTTELTLLRLR